MIATLLLAAGAAFPYPSVTPAEFQSGASNRAEAVAIALRKQLLKI